MFDWQTNGNESLGIDAAAAAIDAAGQVLLS